MQFLSGSTTLLIAFLAGLLLLALIVDIFLQRRRNMQQQQIVQQTVNELQAKLLTVERSLHAIGQRLLHDEKVLRELKQVPARTVVEDTLVNSDYPGQIASWLEQEAERPESMTEAESLLQAMLKQRRVLARA